MKRLPLEMLLMIFEKFDFINLIKLRSICKDWKSIIDNNKIIKELFIDEEYCKFEYLNNNSIIFLDQFKLPGYQIFEKIISSNILQNLKYLNYSFECNYENENKLICLNRFESLEHLVLDIGFRSKYKNFILDHPNIKCLSIEVWNNDGFRIMIICPKCENLRFNRNIKLSNCGIFYPERVKILKLPFTALNENKYGIDKFTNIEQLEIDTEYFSSRIDKFHRILECSTIKSIRDYLYDLVDQNQKKLKKQIKAFKIFVNDEEMKSKKQIEKLIDNEIGESLDFKILNETYYYGPNPE